MEAVSRKNIKPGLLVAIVMKEDQQSGDLTEGVVKDILTKSPNHPYGIKSKIEDYENVSQMDLIQFHDF